MRQKLSEEADHFQYTYDKSKSLLEQVLHTVDNVHLINVRKTYTNNIYFGVYWTGLINDHQPFLAHNFQCKDRGYTEDIVDRGSRFCCVDESFPLISTSTFQSKRIATRFCSMAGSCK